MSYNSFKKENIKTKFYMKKIYLLMLTAGLSVSAMAQQKFEVGKPNNDNYRYLDEYKALKEYINRDKYPNFKLGVGTDVSGYLQNNSIVQKMVNRNFDETVAGNEMKMSSCVDGSGNMNFTTVKNYVNKATSAGLNVYGHTLAWHSQQPKGWLLKLLADKPDPTAGEVYSVVASKDFCKDKTIGFWKADEKDNGYTINFDATNGLKVVTTKSKPWEIQFVPMDNIMLQTGKTYKMTFSVKGSKSGKLDGRIGDWNGGANFTINFTNEWKDVSVNVTPTMESSFMLVHVPNYIGDVYIKSIKFEGDKPASMIPQTAQEMHDTLVYAMDKWIKGMTRVMVSTTYSTLRNIILTAILMPHGMSAKMASTGRTIWATSNMCVKPAVWLANMVQKTSNSSSTTTIWREHGI